MTLQRLRSVARVSARALLVAGFAGGVWLLTSTTAHASAPAATPTKAGQPVLSLLDQVLVPAKPGHHHTRSAAASATRHSVPLLASQATPAGPTRRPVANTGPAALSALLSTVSQLVPTLPAPADLITVPLARLVGPVLTGREESARSLVCHAAAVGATPAGTAEAVPVRAHHSTQVRPSAGTVLRMARAVSRPAVPGTRQVPDLPDRAPVPAYPGSDSTGISTTASGSGYDAGGYAVVSAPVTPGPLAGAERLRARGAAVRLWLADAPTFAPD